MLFQGIFIMRSGAIYCSISVFSAMWAISRIPLRIRPGVSSEILSDLKEAPIYCFRPHRPFSHIALGNLFYRPRTRHLYTAFYWVVQLLLILCTIIALIGIF